MIRNFFLMMLLASIVSIAQAQQSGRPRIYVDDFTHSRSVKSSYCEGARNQVIGGIQKTGRLIVLDAKSEEVLLSESERRTQESAIGDDVARLGDVTTLGANYILSGHIDNISVERRTLEGGTVYYNAQITFTLKATKVSDGTVYSSRRFSSTGGGILFGAGSSQEKAIQGAISLISSKMEVFVDNDFPLLGQIVEMKDYSRKKMKSCYVNLGTDQGVGEGQYMVVLVPKTIAGRSSMIEIGRMKIKAVVAGDLSECSVTRGGDEIMNAFTSGEELVIKTTRDVSLMGTLIN